MKIEVEKDILTKAVKDISDARQIMMAFRNKEVRLCDIQSLANEGARKLNHARYKLNKLAGRDASN